MAGERFEYITLRTVRDPAFPDRPAYNEGEGIFAQVVQDWSLVVGEDVRPARADMLPRPAGNAKRAEWAAYAAMQGLDQDEVDGMTRDQLRERFPEEQPAEQGAQPAEEA